MSAILPDGTRNIPSERRKEVVTQPNKTASISNSFPMDGRAIMTEDPMKGTRAEPSVVTRRADFLLSIDSNTANDTKFAE
jgi:hypothetical protein